MKNNEELQKDVETASKWEPLLHAAEIGVTDDDGIVTLSGVADSYTKKYDLKLLRVKKHLVFMIVLLLIVTNLFAQTDTSVSTFWHPRPRNYEVKQAVEVESLVPMFFYGGFHFAAGYRYKKFRVRVSVINGGTYNAEPAGLKNSKADFKRFYKTSPGIFLGYNVWKNLEVYTYVESHTFAIEQKSTGIQKDLYSTDFGLATSYQFFIGRYFYIQPGLHLYLRSDKGVDFKEVRYNIPNADFSYVVRLGVRLWRQY